MHPSNSLIRAIIDLARSTLDETATNAKFKDQDMVLRYLPPAIHSVMGRLYHDHQNPIYATHRINVTSGTNLYPLPPSIQEVHGLIKFGQDGSFHWEQMPGSGRHHDQRGGNWSLDGNQLRFRPNCKILGDWDLLYIPSPVTYPHIGTGRLIGDTRTFRLAAAPDLGLVDRRRDGYVGATLRLIPSTGYVEEAIIESSYLDSGNWFVTLREPFVENTALDADLEYEIIFGMDPAMVTSVAHYIVRELAIARRLPGSWIEVHNRQLTSHLKTLSDRYSNMQGRINKSLYRFDYQSPPEV